MKVSLICTVMNEEESIKELLDSVVKQTRKPNEFILVDGGSTDKTVEAIKKYKKKLPIKVIVKKGANIAQGRNIGFKNAKYPIVATVDGGTILDKNWVKNIVKNIEKKGFDVSSGCFIAKPENEFEEVVNELLYPKPEKLPEDWCPSSRSAAYRKKAWEAVGGYPEELYTAEDSLFNYRIKKAGFKYRIARDARSYWKPRTNLKKLYTQYFRYAKGNGEALLTFHYPEGRRPAMFYALVIFLIASWFVNPFIIPLTIVLLFALLFLYGLARFKNFKKAWYTFKIIPSLFAANIIGNHYGLWRRMIGKVKPGNVMLRDLTR